MTHLASPEHNRRKTPPAQGRTARRVVGMPKRVDARLLLAGALLAVLPFILFWQVWWPGLNERQVFAHGDFPRQHYPMRSFVSDELRHGRLPLWDPYTFGGQPAVGESLFASFYPLGLWQALFPGRLPFLALEIEAIAHLSLAGIFTFLLVRELTGRAGAGILSGMAFSLGGFLTSYPMLQLIMLETAVWLPAGLWLLERGMSRRSLWGIAAAGLAFGVSILAGFPQTFLYMAYVAGSYLILRAWRLRLGWRFTLSAALILGGVALGLSAVQWLPSLELVRLSSRGDMGYHVLSGGFEPAAFLGLLRPNPGQWSPLYVGLLPLGLALGALALCRRREVWYWGVVAALALGLSLGGNGPLYPLAYRLAPGFNLFRQQERIAFLVSFSLAILAGYGYAALARRRWWPRAALPLAAGLVFVDLWLATGGVILQAPPEGGYFPPTAVTQHLQQVDDPVGRVSSEGLFPGDGNAGMLFGIRDVTGNGPLYLASYRAFLERVPEMRWWQLLNVRYVLTRRSLEHGALEPVLQEGDLRLYQAHLGQSPAWISHAYRLAPGQEAAIDMTADPRLDPAQMVVLEREPDPLPQPAQGTEEVRVTAFGQQRVQLEATLEAPGIVVLSELYYPGWVARVNGRPVQTFRAYGLLRAVALPAGHWQVDWHYEPRTVWVGGALSLLTAAICAGGLVLVRREQMNRRLA